MSVNVTIQARVKPGIYAEFEKFLTENLPNVRGFAGALNVNILYYPQNSDFLIFEEWLSEDHHQTYMDAISKSGVLAQLASFLEAAPDIRYYHKQEL